MATYTGAGMDIPMTASGDLSSVQHHFVQLATTAKRVLLATGASGPAPFGVLQNDPNSLEEANVRILGSTQVYADGGTAISYGDFITSGSSGMAVVAASGYHGIAMEALASGSGILIEVLLMPYHADPQDNTP